MARAIHRMIRISTFRRHAAGIAIHAFAIGFLLVLSIWGLSYITELELESIALIRPLPSGELGTFRFFDVFIDRGEIGFQYDYADLPVEKTYTGTRVFKSVPISGLPRNPTFLQRLGFEVDDGWIWTCRSPIWFVALFPLVPLLTVIALRPRAAAASLQAWRSLLLRYRRRGSATVCQTCGYNLTGNASGVCPECGTPVTPRSERVR